MFGFENTEYKKAYLVQKFVLHASSKAVSLISWINLAEYFLHGAQL